MSRPKPWEVSDELWELIEPLIPQPHRPYGHPGRKRIDDRKTLQGILFVLYTGIQWDFLPPKDGVWLRSDLLAAAAPVATSRGVG